MGISLVAGGVLEGSAINGGNVTISLPTLVQNDVVCIAGGFDRDTVNPSIVTSGYTELVRFLGATGRYNFGVWIKKMGATPDTQVVGAGSGNSNDGVTYGLYCLRGVDTATQIDATTTTVAGDDTNDPPNNPSIITATNGALVIAFAGANGPGAGASIVIPAGYSNRVNSFGDDTRDSRLNGGMKLVAVAGTEDPAAWGSWTTTDWCAATIALRPAAIGNRRRRVILARVA